jgi:hypothetical protein
MTWMTAVRDHPARPPALQVHVLLFLALRMDWQTGCGFASTAQLAADADCSNPTVKRATGWGRESGMLVQARRGHRLGDGRTVASEWRLAIPQRLTGDTLTGASGDQRPHLNGSAEPPQRLTADPPSRPRSSRPRSSANGDGAGAPRPPSAQPETQRRIWPCPGCHEGFTDEDLASEDTRRAAEEGELWHAECQKAYLASDEYAAGFGDDERSPDNPDWREVLTARGEP